MLNRFRFHGGIVLPAASIPDGGIEDIARPPQLRVPLWQHQGELPGLAVRHGERVSTGQVLATGSEVSADVHAPLSGTVSAIVPCSHPWGGQSLAVEIEPDSIQAPFSPIPFAASWRDAAPGELVEKLAAMGVVVMRGAGQSLRQALAVSTAKPIDTLIINAVECEGTTALYAALSRERAERIVNGILLVRKIVTAARVVLVCPRPWKKTPVALSQLLGDERFKEIEPVYVAPRYPLSDPRVLTYAITRRQLSAAIMPSTVGCMVLDIATAAACWDAIDGGMPLISRAVAVYGPTVARPRIVQVPIGTSLRHVLNVCDVDWNRTVKIVAGGALCGMAAANPDTPIIKSINTVFATDTLAAGSAEYPCIKCGNCQRVCPVNLAPSRLFQYVARGLYYEMEHDGIRECIECGLCAAGCPSRINIVHHIRLGKFNLKQRPPADVRKVSL